jgi:CubicO group peptidase (beta-lactamase class C family)
MLLEDKLSELRSKVKALMLEFHIPGVSIGLLVDGTQYFESFGVTSLTNPLAVTPETVFQIASTTKTFVSSMALKLVESGVLELDAPVRQYIPSFALQDETAAATVSIRHLLTHTSGFPGDVEIETGDGADAIEKYVQAMAEFPQIVPVGTLMQYSNSGMNLLGRVLEVVTGQPLDALIRAELLEPMGLSDTVFFPHEAITKRVAVGHLQSEDNQTVVIPVYRMPRSDMAAGGLISSARDQIRYAQYHLGAFGDTVLSPFVRNAMQTKQVKGMSPAWIGMCWFLNDFDGVRLVSHGGDSPGFQSSFFFAPEKNFAFTCLTNANGGIALNTELTPFVRELFLGIKTVAPEPIKTTNAQLEPYIGWYSLPTGNPADGLEIALTQTGLTLRVDVPTFNTVTPPVRIGMLEPDVFMALEGNQHGNMLEFVRQDGSVHFLRAAGRIATRIPRRSM